MRKEVLICAAVFGGFAPTAHCLETALSKYKLTVYGLIKPDMACDNSGTAGSGLDVGTNTRCLFTMRYPF